MKHKNPSSKLCQRISDFDQRRLRYHFADLATRAADKYKVWVFQIRKPAKYRKAAVCRAREEVVLALREGVWYADAKLIRHLTFGQSMDWYSVEDNPRVCLAVFSHVIWTPISTPMIAALFPCNHSAIVLFLNDEKRCRAAARRLAENSDGRNGNDDSSVCGRGDSGDSDVEQSGTGPVERACEAAT